MSALQIEEMVRRVQERLQPGMKEATRSEWKQLEQTAKKMWADLNQIPGLRDGWKKLSGEEILAFPKTMAQILREEKAMKEKEMLFDEAGEPLGIDDAPSPSGMSRSAIIRKAIADAFGEAQLEEIFAQKHNEDVVIFEGLMPTSRLTAQHLLDELCDLQRVDADTVMLCNRRGDRIDLMSILADYIREEGSTIYLRPSGLAGGGYGRGVPKTKKSTASKKRSGYKRMMDEFIDEFKDVPPNEHITFRTQAEEAMSIFYQEAEVDAMGAFERAFSQMSLPALKVAIEATASDSGGDTDSKIETAVGFDVWQTNWGRKGNQRHHSRSAGGGRAHDLHCIPLGRRHQPEEPPPFASEVSRQEKKEQWKLPRWRRERLFLMPFRGEGMEI